MTCADSIHSSQGANSSHSASPVIGENDAPTATNSVETLHGNSVTTTPVEVQPGEISNNGTIEEEIIDSSRLSSPVWQHFVRLKVKGLLKARCNKFRKLLGATAGSGTSHLREHISRCPKRIMKDIRQMLLTKNLKGDVHKSIGTKFDADEGRRALASMIILHEYPMCIVDHIGFRRFLFIIQPLFHCPTRNTIKGDIFKIFDSEKKLLMKQLDANQSRIAITSDMWTASNQKKGFMVVTAHFIDEGWNIQSYILRFLYVPCPHTSELLVELEKEYKTRLQVDVDLVDDELGQLKERSLHTVHEDEDDDLACITDNWFYDHIQQVTANSSGFECILYCIIMEAIADNAIAIGNCSMRRIRK
ncbi:Zinc finger BED domain-containing protein RICESLEEPER 2 [Linum perenne]